MDAPRETHIKPKWLWCLAPVVILLASGWLAFSTREPHYKGQPISHWFTNYPGYYSEQQFNQQYKQAPLDHQAVPFLVNRLRHGPTLYEKFYPRLRKYPWLPIKQPQSSSLVRLQAARVLRQMGPEARKAVPDLIYTLKDPSAAVRVESAMALGAIGSESHAAVPHLLKTFSDKDIFLRVQSLFALAQIAPEQSEVRALLTNALRDPETLIRYRATNICQRLKIQP